MKHFDGIKKDGTEQEKQALRGITRALDFLANNGYYNNQLFYKCACISNKLTIDLFTSAKSLYNKIYDLRKDFLYFQSVARVLRLSINHILSLDWYISRFLYKSYKKYHFKSNKSTYMLAVRTFNRIKKFY